VDIILSVLLSSLNLSSQLKQTLSSQREVIFDNSFVTFHITNEDIKDALLFIKTGKPGSLKKDRVFSGCFPISSQHKIRQVLDPGSPAISNLKIPPIPSKDLVQFIKHYCLPYDLKDIGNSYLKQLCRHAKFVCLKHRLQFQLLPPDLFKPSPRKRDRSLPSCMPSDPLKTRSSDAVFPFQYRIRMSKRFNPLSSHMRTSDSMWRK
jgi:hypothetical protein